MNFINKLERKFGRFAVHNLMIYLIAMQALGFFLLNSNPAFYVNWLSLDISAILHGQIWRLVTFLIFPSNTSIVWFLISSFCFFSIGRLLEQMWGTFRLNLYLIVGIIGIIIGTCLIIPFYGSYLASIAAAGSSTQLYLSMLLAIAATIPDAQFFLNFIIPVKAKWLALPYHACHDPAQLHPVFLPVPQAGAAGEASQAKSRLSARSETLNVWPPAPLRGLRPDGTGRSDTGISLLFQMRGELRILPGASLYP